LGLYYGRAGLERPPKHLYDRAMRIPYTALYIALIAFVNWAFVVVDPIRLPGGVIWPPMTVFVGFVFVVRDFAQREIGHYVLAAMLVGVMLSYFMAGPNVATASALAFLISEMADWSVYSFTRMPLSQRVLWSSVISTPIDTFVFLSMLDFFSITGAAVMTLSKLVGAVIVWWLVRRRELREAIAQIA
jgi:uncharacterized PurR-regulated membrane protein YhhQ (DUF165 family)